MNGTAAERIRPSELVDATTSCLQRLLAALAQDKTKLGDKMKQDKEKGRERAREETGSQIKVPPGARRVSAGETHLNVVGEAHSYMTHVSCLFSI